MHVSCSFFFLRSKKKTRRPSFAQTASRYCTSITVKTKEGRKGDPCPMRVGQLTRKKAQRAVASLDGRGAGRSRAPLPGAPCTSEAPSRCPPGQHLSPLTRYRTAAETRESNPSTATASMQPPASSAPRSQRSPPEPDLHMAMPGPRVA
jgi:hypothetical protein